MHTLHFHAGTGDHRVDLQATFSGADATVVIAGGDSPHIGAVALATPRKSLTGDGSNSASASVLCLTGHMEDELARSIALKLSRSWACHVTVVAGLHIDDASGEDIRILSSHTEELVEVLLEAVASP